MVDNYDQPKNQIITDGWNFMQENVSIPSESVCLSLSLCVCVSLSVSDQAVTLYEVLSPFPSFHSELSNAGYFLLRILYGGKHGKIVTL